MNLETLQPEIRAAIEAAQDKKALELTVLDLFGLGAFSDCFVICTAESGPQMRAICDSVEDALERRGVRPEHREGGSASEWFLLDYGGFVLHVFSKRGRTYYDLERLWRSAKRLDVPPPGPPVQAASAEQ
jgi:ribosome-associated protein